MIFVEKAIEGFKQVIFTSFFEKMPLVFKHKNKKNKKRIFDF